MKQEAFQPLVEEVNKLNIPVSAISGVFALVGNYTGNLTADVLYRAWTAYQTSPAYKSIAVATDTARQAS